MGIQWSRFVYKGSFQPPTGGTPPSSFQSSNGVIAFNHKNNSLFVTGHQNYMSIAEIDIPPDASLVNFALGTALPQSNQLQNFIQPFDTVLPRPGDYTGEAYIYGMAVVDVPGILDPWLVLSGALYYNVNNWNIPGFGAIPVNFAQSSQAEGPWAVPPYGPNAEGGCNMTAGSVTFVPGADAVTYFGGNNLVVGKGGGLINGSANASWGPTAFATTAWNGSAFFAPDQTYIAHDPPNNPNGFRVTTDTGFHMSDHPMLYYYPCPSTPQNIFQPWRTVASGDTQPIGQASEFNSLSWIRVGLDAALLGYSRRASHMCYANQGHEADCNDPCGAWTGTHGSPYHAEVTLYQAADLLANPPPNPNVPFTTALLDSLITPDCNLRGFSTFDPASSRLYLSTMNARYFGQEGYPAIHVFQYT